MFLFSGVASSSSAGKPRGLTADAGRVAYEQVRWTCEPSPEKSPFLGLRRRESDGPWYVKKLQWSFDRARFPVDISPKGTENKSLLDDVAHFI